MKRIIFLHSNPDEVTMMVSITVPRMKLPGVYDRVIPPDVSDRVTCPVWTTDDVDVNDVVIEMDNGVDVETHMVGGPL